MSAHDAATITSVKRERGIAGQYAMHVVVDHHDGEGEQHVSFVANTHGGPVVMKSGTFEVFVSRAVVERLGERVDEQWVRKFFHPETQEV